jgi:hypothetical protein
MTNIGRQLIGENENSQGSQSSISSGTSGFNTEDSNPQQMRITFDTSTSALPLNFDNLLPQIVIVPEVRVEEQPQTQPNSKKRGRPFLTDEQKAANKAERDAKKQSGQAPPKKKNKN